MNSNSKNENVLVIGGGVAGMSAAETLSRHGVSVHLVEKQDRLGGFASKWACMATDTCQTCSACLSDEMAGCAADMENVSVYTGCEVKAATKKNGRYAVRIEGAQQKEITADQVIVATGFKPADPTGLLSDIHGVSDQVITTEQLNQALRSDETDGILSGSENPRIGFIQCVGSRNREIGKDYCSQVCCRISLRQITKLLYLYPEAQITCFYIDLQVIGKETRQQFAAVSDRVELIQGVPSEIFDDRQPGKVTVISEDPEGFSRKALDFDLLVLSVGLHREPENEGLGQLFEIPADEFGFFESGDEGVVVVGTAGGPMDIQTAKHQGIAGASRVLDRILGSPDIAGDVAVIGSGKCAADAAKKLAEENLGVTLLDPGKDENLQAEAYDYVPRARLIGLKGTCGQFSLMVQSDGRLNEKQFAAVVVAEPAGSRPIPVFKEIPQDLQMSLDEYLKTLDSKPWDVAGEVMFILDYQDPEYKAASRSALNAALQRVQQGQKASVLMNKMLVHGLRGQQLYDRARKAGVRFFRVDDPSQIDVSMDNADIVCRFKEKTLGNMDVTAKCGGLVISSGKKPSDHTSDIAQALKEQVDAEGFFQSANVRHQLVSSPKKGVFYLGSGHDDTDFEDDQFQTQLVVDAVKRIVAQDIEADSGKIWINRIKCRKCLKCYRICPHGAIRLEGNTPSISPDACYDCGLCISNCPALAIESEFYADTVFADAARKKDIVVFACERSGAIAAADFSGGEKLKVQKVPCVCRIGENIVLKALEKGPERVILAGCHDGNCRSVKGSSQAELRTRILGRMPGLNPADIVWYPVAANEKAKFEKYITGIPGVVTK